MANGGSERQLFPGERLGHGHLVESAPARIAHVSPTPTRGGMFTRGVLRERPVGTHPERPSTSEAPVPALLVRSSRRRDLAPDELGGARARNLATFEQKPREALDCWPVLGHEIASDVQEAVVLPFFVVKRTESQ
jgi:hypothetical protein